jgi:sialate O-acetylesterase
MHKKSETLLNAIQCSLFIRISMIIFCISALTISVHARIILPSVIADNMVLQQQSEITLWGWTTTPSEVISIKADWGDELIKTKANAGRWSAKMQTPGFGGPFTITISGHETITLTNIYLGDVWLASGQSNMEMPVDSVRPGFPGVDNYRNVIAKANHNGIRFFTVAKQVGDFPQDDCTGQWNVCTPENVKDFSATAYFFALNIHKATGIPIGIISSSWGGTRIEPWFSEKYQGNASQSNIGSIKPGMLYNKMIYPVEQFTIKGAIWYQGESNRLNASEYTGLMQQLISSWREARNSDFPFYYVQIAPYTYRDAMGGAYLREAQLKALQIPKTGMAVTNDIGNLADIHPANKAEVGRRLALWALAKDYGQKITYSGPLFRNYTIEKQKIVITFDYTDKLTVKGKKLTGFEIAGADAKFRPANAKVKENSIEVSSADVKNPVAVRFAFNDTVIHNLFNEAGLPASPFRTDSW